MGFPRQEYWSGLLFPSPGDLPNSEIRFMSPTLQVGSLPLRYQRSPFNSYYQMSIPFFHYFKNPGIILSYTLIPSTSTPASPACSHLKAFALSLYPPGTLSTRHLAGVATLHCMDCALSSASV
ncbi:unnamed protein product [Rangifer tarandus platyrhynchus]|uniref:Uncharacterized protein n=1 Tax=Rangifer tarandus platyrhynchus TaxID=3082113 RepID=A0AC59Z061_RANTA